MLNHLFVGPGMAAFGQTSELFRGDRSSEAHLFGELTLPLPLNGAVLLVIVRCLGGELQLVVGLRLTGAERFRNVERSDFLSALQIGARIGGLPLVEQGQAGEQLFSITISRGGPHQSSIWLQPWCFAHATRPAIDQVGQRDLKRLDYRSNRILSFR